MLVTSFCQVKRLQVVRLALACKGDLWMVGRRISRVSVASTFKKKKKIFFVTAFALHYENVDLALRYKLENLRKTCLFCKETENDR